MPVIDKIRRSGLSGRSVLTGPAQLKPPLSRGVRTLGARFGLSGLIDQYEIGLAGTGAPAGTYAFSLKPVSQNGLRARHRGVAELLIAKQANGVNAPTTALTLVARRKPRDEDTAVSITAVDCNDGDRLYVLVALDGKSQVRYDLEVDQTAHLITISGQPPNRSIATGNPTTFTVTASTNDGGSLSYQWQVSTNGGTSYSNVTNAGVYTGATTATLSISNVAGLNTYRYRVLVSSTGGAATATSSHGVLTVT